jgi:hypothetical protein
MALFPVHARERDALGLFKKHSTFAGGEGGLIVRLLEEGKTPTVAPMNTSGAVNTALHGLLDEQLSHPETSIGRFLAPNSNPVAIGPATHLGSGKVSLWLESGWFLTNSYDIAVDGYGEAATLVAGDILNAKTSGVVGQLTDGAGSATRVRYMQMVDDASDLLASRVSPAPTTGMFAEKALILVYQTHA